MTGSREAAGADPGLPVPPDLCSSSELGQRRGIDERHAVPQRELLQCLERLAAVEIGQLRMQQTNSTRIQAQPEVWRAVGNAYQVCEVDE